MAKTPTCSEHSGFTKPAARTHSPVRCSFFSLPCFFFHGPNRTFLNRPYLRLVGLKTPTDLSAKQTHAREVTIKNVNFDRGCHSVLGRGKTTLFLRNRPRVARRRTLDRTPVLMRAYKGPSLSLSLLTARGRSNAGTWHRGRQAPHPAARGGRNRVCGRGACRWRRPRTRSARSPPRPSPAGRSAVVRAAPPCRRRGGGARSPPWSSPAGRSAA